MAYLLVRHKVQDFATWKAAFDDHGSDRKASGSMGGLLFRNTGDPNEVLVLMEWDSAEHAQRFVDSQDLGEAMQRAGVAEKPDIFVLEEVDRPTQ
ncbi:MAG: antibiotic biosynthesis monooxygenase [Planctomycetota bacterium]|jgi:heme-degrading monooxygenase HmoA